LSPLQSGFDVTGEAGIPGALNDLYTAFSTWSSSATDGSARQGVISAAQSVAQEFQQESTVLDQAATDADSQLAGLVNQVNSLGATIQQINVQRQGGNAKDPSLDAQLYNALEELSQLVPVQALQQPDGSTTVLVAGQIPLVVGSSEYKLSSGVGTPTTPAPTNPTGPSSAIIRDSTGKDVTGDITEGQVGGLLQARNVDLAQLRGDSQQQGQLNVLAQAFADRVNTVLTSGNISDAVAATSTTAAVPAVSGVPLFTYDATKPSSIAKSLSVSSTITASQLAAISPGPPEVSNGVALELASLATPQNDLDKISSASTATTQSSADKVSYLQYFGSMAAALGTSISTAESNQTASQGLVTQAQSLREQTSGVSLDTEAIKVLEFQRSYQAVSKMVTILDNLTQTVINMLQ
jgi:flagellar hook-associated protein 1 FlgK